MGADFCFLGWMVMCAGIVGANDDSAGYVVGTHRRLIKNLTNSPCNPRANCGENSTFAALKMKLRGRVIIIKMAAYVFKVSELWCREC